MLGWSVTPSTLQRYRTHVDRFLDWFRASGERAATTTELDEVTLDYIHHLYEQGQGRTAAAMTICGLQLLCVPDARFPRCRRALKGWAKRHPGRSHPPLSWELTAAIAFQMSRSGLHRYACGVLIGFDCLLRVSELCNLRREDVADTGDLRIGVEHKGMMLRLPSTKTGKNQWVEALDPCVIQLLRDRVRGTSPGARLFSYTASQFRRVFMATCANLGLSKTYVPHSLRHGGATRYRHVLKWSIENVLERGRWVSTASARRYVQSGLAVLMSMEAPPAIAQGGVVLAKRLYDALTLAQEQYTA